MERVSSPDTSEIEQHILERVADALLTLSNVAFGDYADRLPIDADDNTPLPRLFAGINEMIDALNAEEVRSRAYQQELEEKLQTIENQRLAIAELSTPIMQVWEGVVCVPIVGLMDTTRSTEMTSALLTAVVENPARCAIIDITGIDVMDTSTVDHFIRMAKSIRMLGAKCMLTGMSPPIAQTMVNMGIDLRGLTTCRTLRDALQQYVIRAVDPPRKTAAKRR